MQNISPDLFKQIQESICLPEGTVTFRYTSPDLFNKEKPGGIIMQIPSGQHLFRLERDNNLFIHFYHSSPGTGTRVASIDLKNMPEAQKVFFAFSWSPDEINLHIGPDVPNGELIHAKGVVSKKQYRVDKNGNINQIGDDTVEVMNVSVYENGMPVLQPTALDAWNETMKAFEILATGESPQGYIYEVVVTNLTLAMLVTGFEAYAKKRFCELEQEGINPNTKAIIDTFYSKEEKETNIANRLQAEATNKKTSILQAIVEKGIINFQSYKKCKLAYSKGYGIKFGELGFPNPKLEEIQSYIQYRHKIIHISASLGILNLENIPPQTPIFPKKELAEQARDCFDEFISSLHKATLSLRSIS